MIGGEITFGGSSMPVIYVVIFAGICIFSAVSAVMSFISNKNAVKAYLEKHPDAVKVYLKSTYYVFMSSRILVGSVDDERPALFNGGVYVKPGTSVLMLQYFKSRAGFFYRRVNSSTDFVDVEVNLEPGKEYLISFDRNDGFVVKNK